MQSDLYFPFPLTKGIYDTSPKMARLYLPNGAISDGMPEFVRDSAFEHYIERKLHNLSQNQERYRTFVDDKNEFSHIARRLIALFAQKCPKACSIRDETAYFLLSSIAINLTTGALFYQSQELPEQTEEIIKFLASVDMPIRLFDTLALHVQEDFAITARNPAIAPPNDYLEFAHICFPSHWDPRKKIGKHFGAIHQPVANNAQLLKAHLTLINSMIERGPFTRFVWGIAFSSDLDRHPEYIKECNEPPCSSQNEMIERAYLRVERQVTYPCPDLNRSFFTIRVFLKPLREVARNQEHRQLLRDALISMNDEALSYKGLTAYRDDLVSWLYCSA